LGHPWKKFGEILAPDRLRIYLTGTVCLEHGRTVMDERQFPARQGRLVFAYLVRERLRPVTRDELADAIWADALPPSWEAALSALVSKLRHLLQSLDLPAGAASISGRSGRYQMQLPSGTWVDIEAAAQALDEAEGSLRAGAIERAWGAANVVVTIARRSFLPGEDGLWVELQCSKLRDLLVRGLDCLSDISVRNHEVALAIQYTNETLRLEPYREAGYQRLMRAHAMLGNRAEVHRVYERCRKLLMDEVGIDPSPELETLYRSLLRLPLSAGEAEVHKLAGEEL
jgi:SARP family transcriptional regulator, regulator of embCAB operon